MSFGLNELNDMSTHWSCQQELHMLQINMIKFMSTSCDCSKVNATENLWWQVNIGLTLGNGLVQSGNKSLPEPMLTQIHVAIWHQYATMS